MSAERRIRVERIALRIRPEQKRRIEEAASLRGVPVSTFILKHASDAAQRALMESKMWSLLSRDRDLFVEALLNPPRPTEALRDAARRHKQRGANQ